jgi:glutamate-ammonia-ligase adenylyltransferase
MASVGPADPLGPGPASDRPSPGLSRTEHRTRPEGSRAGLPERGGRPVDVLVGREDVDPERGAEAGVDDADAEVDGAGQYVVRPRVGALAVRPAVLESVLSAPDFFQSVPGLDRLTEELESQLDQSRDWEDLLDLARRWANERRFQVAVHRLLELTDVATAIHSWSNIAEVALRCLLPRVEAEFALTHGRIADAGLTIVAMGKLGSQEMTARSDLDLIVVYPTLSEGVASDGSRPLPAPQYFARLSQRLINALTAPTSEGRLYEVDMRLRPSGKAGPIAVSCETFERYQLNDAWTWEQMALTRARVIAGPPRLVEETSKVIRRSLLRPRDPEVLVVDIAEMRGRMAAERPTKSLWDVKHVRGGLIDIEFIAQYLQLRYAHQHPSVLSPNTTEALIRSRDAGLLSAEIANELLAALTLWQAVQSRLRLSMPGQILAIGGEDAPPLLRQAVDGLQGLSFDRLVTTMQETAHLVRARFAQLIEQPAAAVLRHDHAVPQGERLREEGASDEP